MIKFVLTSSPSISEVGIFILYHSGWNDWWKYETLYRLDYKNEEGETTSIGTVKIAQIDSTDKVPNLPIEFESLGDNFISLGQDSDYYKKLDLLGEDLREKVLISLRDLSFFQNKFKEYISLPVVRESLLRDVSALQVRSEFKRLADGIIELTKYNIAYTAYSRSPKLHPPIQLNFDVDPNSEPPSNVHVIIGRNGVGKTYLLNNMINALLNSNDGIQKYGFFTNENLSENLSFRHLVSVNFSAFDDTLINKDRKSNNTNIGYNYIGLTRSDSVNGGIKTPRMLTNEFVKAIEVCSRGAKHERWRSALRVLETDPVFSEADITSITEIENHENVRETANNVFKKLSSGHKIILLSITKLVATVEEKTLVILDEPETHLHPPLLSAYIRSLSSLLIKRNAVALIATHSPVVLQEVSNLCVWKLFRQGNLSTIKRINRNTFGENVGVLTHEVFGLEVTNSGFHKILEEAVKKFNTFEEINDYFNHALGFEAQSIVRQLLHLKSTRNRFA